MWDWSRNILIPNALPKTLYNSKDVPSYGFFEDGYNNLLSSARLRLLRVNKGALYADYNLVRSQYKICITGNLDLKIECKKQTPSHVGTWRVGVSIDYVRTFVKREFLSAYF